MSNNLKICNFQADLIWQSPKDNLQKLWDKAEYLKSIDLLVCPEMYTTGFSMNVESIAEVWTGDSVAELQKLSNYSDVAIICSLAVKEGEGFYNRLVFITPNKDVKYYDKRHLFTMGNEHLHYSKGTNQLIVTYKGWRIMPLVCYDLRFPVWSRNTNKYDVLVYVANWPDSRKEVWNTLLKARAIENQSYVIGCNRVGTDANQLNYSGNSAIIDPKGDVIKSTNEYEESHIESVLNYEDLLSFREKFPVLNDGDTFNLNFD